MADKVPCPICGAASDGGYHIGDTARCSSVRSVTAIVWRGRSSRCLRMGS